ncbi:MAG: hypothetical protein AAGI71_14045 [Bacteroidota bacterium]
MSVPPYAAFLRDCFLEDNRQRGVLDLFARSVAHRLFVEGKEELLTQVLNPILVDREAGEAARQAAQTYHMDKALVYTTPTFRCRLRLCSQAHFWAPACAVPRGSRALLGLKPRPRMRPLRGTCSVP